MRILDKDNNELKEIDNLIGYLIKDRIFKTHHEAVEAVEEQGHYETIREYPNGGKDVKWVVDVPEVEAKEAYDEYEEILRFVEYSKQERAAQMIEALKQKLRDTDYIILKVFEGATTLAEIGDTIKARANWRKEINALEKEVETDGA